MKLTTAQLDDLMAVECRAELAAKLTRMQADLALPIAQQLTSRLKELAPASRQVRIGIVRTYTTDLLDPWISFECALQDLHAHVYHAPYGYLLQEASASSGLAAHRPDITVLMLQREDLHPDLRLPISDLAAPVLLRLKESALEYLSGLVDKFREIVPGHVVVSLLPPMAGPAFGIYDAQAECSEVAWWETLKVEFARHLRENVPSSLFLDLDQAVSAIGREHFFDPRFWFSARFPFSPAGSHDVAHRVAAIASSTRHPKAKAIVLDADNTLWGGVIGEDGMQGIALGPDYPGSTYVAFQRRLLDYQQRGFVLAMCSKNNPNDVDEVLERHPHQVLKARHFVARRVNWEAKTRNLVALAEELNLGLESIVFVDDSDHECALVRRELPQIQVVQVPRNPVEIPGCLDREARLEIVSLTVEDRAKTAMYAAEQMRRTKEQEVAQRGGDLDEYLSSLRMHMRIGIDEPRHVARLAQLTQKTNQFNLTTRRYSEHQIRQFIDSPDHTVAHFSLADTFGDSGIVGLAVFDRPSRELAVLQTFLMSCRVIGRRAEFAFLEALIRELSRCGVTAVQGEYLPTAKNVLAKDFLRECGFDERAGSFFQRRLDVCPPQSQEAWPILVTLDPADPKATSDVSATKASSSVV